MIAGHIWPSRPADFSQLRPVGRPAGTGRLFNSSGQPAGGRSRPAVTGRPAGGRPAGEKPDGRPAGRRSTLPVRRSNGNMSGGNSGYNSLHLFQELLVQDLPGPRQEIPTEIWAAAMPVIIVSICFRNSWSRICRDPVRRSQRKYERRQCRL